MGNQQILLAWNKLLYRMQSLRAKNTSSKRTCKYIQMLFLGGMSVLLPMYSYWNLVAWDFLPALLCAIPFILLTLLISCILIVRKIQFII